MEHLEMWRNWGSKMDWQAQEDDMLKVAGKAGGEYLEEIGQTNLSLLTKDQWLEFLRCIVGRLSEIRPDVEKLNDDIPF